MTDKEFYEALGSVLRNERTKRNLSLLYVAERAEAVNKRKPS